MPAFCAREGTMYSEFHLSCDSDSWRMWTHLPTGLLSSIMKFLSSKDLISASGVCRSWRELILQDKIALRDIQFSIELSQALLNQNGKIDEIDLQYLPTAFLQVFPSAIIFQSFVHKAVEFDNVSALRCYGLLLDEAGQGEKGFAVWNRLYRLKDVYGLWKKGEILYEGRPYQPANHEDAFSSLSRAAKKAKSFEEGEEKRRILSKVGIYLGYCFLDGDGCRKEDLETAVYWFRLAAFNGNEDAQRVCGFLFNTGMYG